jgi:sugar phosphate isomerase/epimerase
MRFAFNSVAFHRSALDAVVPLIAELGYDGIELNAETLPWATPHVTPGLTRGDRHHLQQLLRGCRLPVSSISAHINFLSPEPRARQEAIAFVNGCIDLACDLEARVVHGLTGSPPRDLPCEIAWEWLLTGMQACIDHAGTRGVTFAIEPVVNMLVCDSASMRRLTEQLGDSRLKVNFDPSHLQVHGDDPVRAVREFGLDIVHVHLKDAAGTPENYEFPPLGQGRVDFVGVLRALKDVGFTEFLSIEYEANAFGYAGEPAAVAKESRVFCERISRQAFGESHGRSI